MGRPAGTRYAILPPALALLVVCAFALSPVDYRGGATHLHPHSPIQLWYDVADGGLDHHGRETGGAGVSPAGGARAADASGETPRLGALASAERAPWVLAVTVVSLVATATRDRVRPVWPSVATLAGNSLHPEPPPPRPLVA